MWLQSIENLYISAVGGLLQNCDKGIPTRNTGIMWKFVIIVIYF